MRHIAKVHVRWDDQDAFGHVNNAKYLTYVQEARVEMLWRSRANAGLEPLLSDMVVARAEVDYLLPIYEGAMDIDCEIWVGKIGGASFEMFYELKSAAGLHARVKTVQVGVDVVTKKSRRLNDAEREYLMQYQELDGPAI
jgi:acyl-CoA thioester hydrolase